MRQLSLFKPDWRSMTPHQKINFKTWVSGPIHERSPLTTIEVAMYYVRHGRFQDKELIEQCPWSNYDRKD